MKDALRHRLNCAFDRNVARGVSWRGRTIPGFQLYACLALALATLVALVLASIRELSLGWMVAAILAAGAACLVFALGYKVITGDERLVFLHHVALAIGAAALMLRWAGEDILRYVEILAVSFGILLAVGRIGCLCAGCCHGRPHDWGVRYGARHVAEGFPASLEGVRLLPVPVFESAWTGSTAIACTISLAAGAPTGITLSSFLPLYAFGRFGCELGRGDAARKWWGPLSHAQWLCLGLSAVALGAQVTGILPSNALSFAIACVVLVLLTGALAFPRLRERVEPFHPTEVDAIAFAKQANGAPEVVLVHTTPRGWRFSRGWIESNGGSCLHWAVSGFPRESRLLGSLVRLLLRLEGLPGDTPVRIEATQRATHILVFPEESTS